MVAFYRLWLGAVVLTIIMYALGKRLTWSTLRATWLGGLFLAGDMTMFYSAVRLTSIVDVSVIGAFQPALVLIVARPLFGERMSRTDVGWILLAMAGVSVAVIGPGAAGHDRVLGDLLALGASVEFHGVLARLEARAGVARRMEYTAGVTIFAALGATPIVLLSSQSLGRVHASDWIWIGLLAVVPGSGHLVMNWAHRFVDASISSAISCLAPLVAAVVAIPILGQSLSLLQVGGVVVGLSAIAVVAARHREPVTPAIE